MLREGVPHKHLEGSSVYMYFPCSSLENKLFGTHQTSFLPVEALEFSELKAPLVHTFFPPMLRGEFPLGTTILPTGLTPEYCGKGPQSNESYERENP